jgi:hypothetical protein
MVFLFSIDFSDPDSCEDAIIPDRFPVALFAEVVNISVTNPYHPITLLRDAFA